MWEYRASLDRVVDGDTIDFEVDLGFNVYTKVRVRLKGVDTHETYGVSHDSEEFALGQKETAFVVGWLEDADNLTIQTEDTGKYGRWIATVERADSEQLNERLIREFDVASER